MDQFYQQQPQQMYSTAPVAPADTTSILGLNIQDSQFWKGALLGAAVALLLTNESVQKGVVKGVSQLTAAAQSGIEEMKEKFEDAKAEAKAEAGTEAGAEAEA
ncbi:MAG: hypothetical protein COA36_09625 [Desulfotalea sp.]|nr:MAG: hypothetical protein COA36_09625 [Desulfotalea sp.]